jgi:hypothetical protein
MSAVIFQDYADDRADILASHDLNGLRLVLVTLPEGPNPDHAELKLHFFNDLHLGPLLDAVTGSNKDDVDQIFRLRGGTRLIAGRATGQVKVEKAEKPEGTDPTRITLHTNKVGDYSTYTLELVWDAHRIDPFFSSIAFKFRPGCFTNDCAPSLPGRPQAPGPAIDYLAKDYDSFRHTLMVAMAERVPGWASTSEADHDQVLIDLLAAVCDHESDFQDRVMAEAYLATARKRVSLARHARLVDYHLHQGNQASTWLAVELTAGQARSSPVHARRSRVGSLDGRRSGTAGVGVLRQPPAALGTGAAPVLRSPAELSAPTHLAQCPAGPARRRYPRRFSTDHRRNGRRRQHTARSRSSRNVARGPDRRAAQPADRSRARP